MKLRLYVLSLISAVFIGVSFAQTPEQFKQITKDYDQRKLTTMAKKFSSTYKEENKKAIDYARKNNLPVEMFDDHGNFLKVYRLDEHGNLVYRTTLNVNAAKTIGVDKLYPGGGLGLELTGEGMIAGIWDGGRALLTHELLEHKITLKDASPQFGDHATHVAGTMVGRKLTGQTSQAARGMAYEAELHSYDWGEDLEEMALEAASGLLISNHSYGINLGSVTLPSAYLGVYNQFASDVDDLASSAPYYSIVAAAGNDRGKGINTTENGYNLLAGEFTTAKNTIVVAAVEKVLEYEGPSSVIMSDFSSWGPTKDNRIKPDISADGVMVLSSIQTATTDYAYSSGTSMASPGVSGSLILLQQLSSELNNGKFLKAATIKALIIQTAREAGDTPGPDPRFGWGLLNVADAAQLMVDSHANSGSFYEEPTLNNNGTYTKKITYSGDGPLKATIAWTDPAGAPTPFGNASVLINDLDLRITDSQGNTYYPWRLGPSHTSPALKDGDNAVDNVEQVVVDNAIQGEEYTITVTHKGQLQSGQQDFGIAVSGSEPLSVESHELTGVSLYPNPASNKVNLKLEQTGNQIFYSIYDLNGRKIQEEKLKDNSGSTHLLDVSKLNSGIYFINIETNGKKTTRKLIIK